MAKTIDEHCSALRWYLCPYSYDSRAVWQNFDMPLHPDAEGYYREMGHLPVDINEEDNKSGYGLARSMAITSGSLVVILAMVLYFTWRRER